MATCRGIGIPPSIQLGNSDRADQVLLPHHADARSEFKKMIEFGGSQRVL